MGMQSLFVGALRGLFGLIRKNLMPSKKDYLGGIIITLVVYLVFGISAIILLPLIVVGVLITYVLRRMWKAFLIYWTYRAIRKKTTKGVDRLKSIFKRS